MGACEGAVEPSVSSPTMLVGDRVGEVRVGLLEEGMGDCFVEPLLSLGDGLDMPSSIGEDGLVLQSASDSNHILSPLEAREVKTMDNTESDFEETVDIGCGYPDVKPKVGNMSTIELGVSRICVDETQCKSEIDPCASNPVDCSSLDNDSRALLMGSSEPDLQCVSEKYWCLDSDQGLGFLDVIGRDKTDGCSMPDEEDKIFEISSDFDHSHVNHELGNVSSIQLGLSRIYVDDIQCKNERDSCPRNQIDHLCQHQVLSEVFDNAHYDSTIQNETDYTASGDNPYRETLLEVISDNTLAEAVADGSSKSVAMLEGSTPNCGSALNFTHAVGSYDHVEKEAEENDRMDDEMCKIRCLDAPSSSLRRSSRSRKGAQNVQGDKHATKSMNKASILSRCATIDLFSNTTRKKRSCLSRSICSSGWGLSGNLSKYFDLSNGVTIDKVLGKVSKRGKGGNRIKKKDMVKVVASSKTSEGVQGVPYRPIRLKITFGKKEELKKVDVMPAEAVVALSVIQSDDGCKPPVCSQIEGTAGKSTCTDTIQLAPQKLAGSHADKYTDPGTSPDSEVIDRVSDSNVEQSALTFLHNPLNVTSNGTTVSGNDCSLLPCKKSKKKSNKKDKLFEASDICMEDKVLFQSGVEKAKKKRRNKKDKLCEASNPVSEDTVLCQDGVAKAKSRKGGQQIITNGSCFKGTGITAVSENSSGSELILTEQLPVSEKDPLKALSLDNGADSNVCTHMVVGIESADSGNPCRLLSSDGVQEKIIPKDSNAKGKSRSKSKLTDATKKEEEPCGKLKSDKRKGKSTCKVSEHDSLNEAYSKGSQTQKGDCAMLDVSEIDTGNAVLPENVPCLDVLPVEWSKQVLPPRSAWVCCDDCLKWRCIPAELADAIEDTHCRWTCKDNQDQAFADCSIPQEKSNDEINIELQISDEEDGRGGYLGSKGSGIRNAIASQPSTWMLIYSNLFLHRSRKTQTMDEVMVCHCKLPENGRLGCGNQCLNRMLNIECVQGTCPCGDQCSNQQFQKRQYAKLNWFRCGKKGYGLQAADDIFKGQFLIEYVGEVLDLHSYEARQKDYASKGYKHFYFMTLNGNEVIDAGAKGNLGRFVNHSCDPNCRTEKWVVNGEICVGLFALRSIGKGEELTFDYNYVRVFGAAAKKCHCGSLKCRGYIGGDPNNSEVIVQADSDEEFPEPVVIKENGEIDRSLENVMAKPRSHDVELVPNKDDLCEDNLEVIIEDEEKVNKIAVGSHSPDLTKNEKIDEVQESLENLTAIQREHVKDETVSTLNQLQSTRENAISTSISSRISDDLPIKNMVKNSLSGSTASSGRISEVDIVEGHGRDSPSKPRPRTKISRPSKSVKNRKSNSNSSGGEKVPGTSHKSLGTYYKPRKLPGSSTNCHLEEVEKKLNELLDADGGICKRKDASKGYLKLLLLTAASGDSGNGGSIQSNRDLSMILDAMLKTKSRGLLLDIINKNGLQMLHNMMKLYRRDFKKIPILRKLLKVLEFLAEKEIITVERINGDPLRAGVESFRASILSFTEHEDKKVHQIARSFRDRWIRFPIRKFNGIDKSDRKREFNRNSNSNWFVGNHHQRREHGVRVTEAIDCIQQSPVSNIPVDVKMQEAPSVDTVVSRPRKRKSRWDQDKEPKTSSQKIKTSSIVVDQGIKEIEENLREPSFKADDPMQTSDDDAPPPGFSSPHILEDAPPPGFSSPHNPPVLQCPPSVSKGFIQERFDSHLRISYGIPFSVLQQFGTLDQLETTVDRWVIAPSIPFQPFPPLPSFPRDKSAVENRGQEELRRDQSIPSTSGFVQPNMQNRGSPNQQHMNHHREKGFRRCYQPQQRKWNNNNNNSNNNNNNNTKYWHPRPGRRNGWGFKGNHNHPRNAGLFMRRLANEQHQNGQLIVDVNRSVEFAGNSC